MNAIILGLMLGCACAEAPPQQGAPHGLFDRLTFEKWADERETAKNEALEQAAKELEVDSNGEVKSQKKGSFALAGIIAIVVKKVLAAILAVFILNLLWSYIGYVIGFVVAVGLFCLFCGFIGARMGR